jgi:hypothetical protein
MFLCDPHSSKVFLTNINQIFISTAVNSQIVWGYLENCDIFGAAKVVVQSKLLLEAYSSNLGMFIKYVLVLICIVEFLE